VVELTMLAHLCRLRCDEGVDGAVSLMARDWYEPQVGTKLAGGWCTPTVGEPHMQPFGSTAYATGPGPSIADPNLLYRV
jgi:hypothetical protein